MSLSAFHRSIGFAPQRGELWDTPEEFVAWLRHVFYGWDSNLALRLEIEASLLTGSCVTYV